MSKRQDLQGIRGIAIISVLLFHFYPKYFPNGYLGVDQFFVLSGFLMCMLLTKSSSKETSNTKFIANFYWRRLKRILPLYFLIILISLFFLHTKLFPETAVELNISSAWRALFFVSNEPKSAEQDYFEMLSLAVDVFTHTWSLSVEVQFYLIIPILFIFAKNFSTKHQMFYLLFFGINSFIFYTMSTPTIAFNSVFSRIWQFMCGMIVYLLIMQKQKEEFSPIFWTTFIWMLAIQFWPTELPAGFVRPLLTFQTGILILISCTENPILSNPILTYIGDVSYSLYLIHWPIYACAKLSISGNSYGLFICLLISFVLAMIVYESYERWYLDLESEKVAILIGILFLSNVVFVNKDAILIGGQRNLDSSIVWKNMTIDDAEKLNKEWTYKDTSNLLSITCKYESKSKPFGWCEHAGLKSDAKFKFMIFGNSWTANHATMFYSECGHLASRIVQNGAYGCEPLYLSKGLNCAPNFKKIEENLEKLRPDYAFHIARFMSIGDENEKEKEDKIYETMKKQLDIYLKYIKYKLYILDAIPRIKHDYVAQIVPLLKNGTSVDDVNKILIEYRYWELARSRMQRLFKECGEKCVRIDYFDDFYDKKRKDFRYFDEKGFSYFTAINHLSPYGIEKIRPHWREICKKLG
ncbi:unnamed protein product [Caenorhabditis angaria]|uniref:Acyl_transf_3 domain-containing protein n=1 Tax=Caenorhabditis angaria TaxID=860376 RepID=A0A9P1ILI4_9PELO|nr:unnamed protein product [Caenorhabditis angaria]